MSNHAEKIGYLDSLRGLAAVVVVASHFAGAFFPYTIFGEQYKAWHPAEAWFHYAPLATTLAGHFAVCLFFVLSGFVLSCGTLHRRAMAAPHSSPKANDNWWIAKASIKRPIRLAGVVVASLAIGFAVQALNLYQNKEVAPFSGSVPWFASFWSDQPSAVRFLIDLVFCPFTEGENYNPPLWTIKKELFGSYIVFAYLLATIGRSWRTRKLILAVLFVLFFRSLYVGFVLGVMLAEFQSWRYQPRPESPDSQAPKSAFYRSWGLLFLLLVGISLGGSMHYVPQQFEGPFAGAQQLLLQEFGTGSAAMAGAFLVFFVVLLSARMQRFLSVPWLCYLGRISYALYALHFILLGSLSCFVYLACQPFAGHGWSAVVAVGITVVCLIPAAHLMTVTVDRWSIATSSLIADKVLASAKLVGDRWRGSSIPSGRKLARENLAEASHS